MQELALLLLVLLHEEYLDGSASLASPSWHWKLLFILEID
jgi:hypothetical protein